MNALFYKKIIEQSPIGYAFHKIICDHEGTPVDYEFIEVNSTFQTLTGLIDSDIIGKRITEVLPGINKCDFDWIKIYGEVALHGGTKEFEQFAEPLQRWYKVYTYAPEKYYFITLFTDISKEKEQCIELNYPLIVENISDVVWIADMQLRITYISPSIERLLGESVSEHLSKPMEERFPPGSLHKIISTMQEELAKEKEPGIEKNRTRLIEVEHYRMDGTTIWIAMHVSFIRDAHGNPIGVQGVTRDITANKLMAEQLR